VAERRGGTGQREALELKARIFQMSDAERRALLETARRDKGQA
jgi:hypothetical protein